MKIYAIRDASIDRNRDLAWLLYYEPEKKFYIEISRKTDAWEAPLILSSFVAKSQYSVDSRWSAVWVEQRIIPSERQNLGMILKANGLDEYDEFRLLVLADGRCAQDDCFLKPVSVRNIPEELLERFRNNLSDVILSGERLLLFYRDGTVQSVEERSIINILRQKNRLSAYDLAIRNIRVQPGGHALRINDDAELMADEARRAGMVLPVGEDVFRAFIKSNLVDTVSAAQLLNCTRQNIRDLVKRGRLHPVLTFKNCSLFLKQDLTGMRVLQGETFPE